MAILSLATVFARLPIASVEWDIRRNDQLAGLGSGDVMQTELADPVWSAAVTLGRGLHDELKQAAALIRRLHGAKQPFFMCDPTSLFPQADPKGLTLGAAAVTVRAVSANRSILQLQGLPAGYVLTIGDKLQIAYAGGRHAFHEVAETAAATVGGQLDVQVFPFLPFSLAIGLAVTLKQPACPVVVDPATHRPGTARRSITEGAGFTVIQKKSAS